MYSIAFPKMFTTSRTLLKQDHAAIAQNLILLLHSEKTSLFGDPYYGVRLKQIIFSQSNLLIKDLIVDEIYTAILMFMPQLILTRKDVEVTTDGIDVYAKVRCTFYLDQVADLYQINLTNNSQ